MNGKELELAKLSIETTGVNKTKIILNGKDISMQCRKITFTHEARHTPTVQVELYVEECLCHTVGSAALQPVKPELDL